MSDWTIKNLLSWSSDYFRDKGFDHPRLDAELLLCFLLKARRLDLYLLFDRPLSEQELASYKQLVKRRVAHEPVAYIIGLKEFHSLEFKISPDVLIPRPETEFLVDAILDFVKKNADPAPSLSGFEMGLGSGVVSISLLKKLPTLTMTAAEISDKTALVAAENAHNHGVDQRLKIVKTDFLSPEFSQSFATQKGFLDFVVANPPYVTTNECETLAEDVRKFEPRSALDGGVDGLKFYAPLAIFAQKMLRNKGLLAVEIGETQGNEVKTIFQNHGFLQIEVKKDYAGHDRIVTGIKNG